MSSAEWVTPLATALSGIAGGGALVAWLQRDKTEADTEVAHAEARKTAAETESLTVQTIQNALKTVESLSAAKDEQLATIRNDMQEQGKRHTDQMLAQQEKHQDEMRSLQAQIRGLTEQQAAMASALAAHGQWDLYVLAHVRQSMPDFPDPPPLTMLLGEDT